MGSKLTVFAQVRALEGWHAVAFAATLIERMQPNYTLFCEVTEYTDASIFRNVLNTVWEWLSVPKAKINFAAQLEKIESNTPDPADFDTYGVYPAVDAALSLAAVIQLMQKEDLSGAVVVSKLSQGSVEAYIDATSEEELDSQAIKAHPLMTWEVETQQELLQRLATLSPGAKSAKLLREFACQEGISNLGLVRED